MTVEEYFGDWSRIIDREELFKVTAEINRLYNNRECEPAYNNIFRVFNITPYSKLCMIWLSQDPYFQKGVSSGIAFANKKDVLKLSPSLQVIKDAVINLEVPHNLITFDPSLEEWSKQGILLLNSALTVEVNKPGSHAVLWRNFTVKLLQKLSELNPGLIYVLWGSQAKSFIRYIDNTNIIYKMPHPAYYARNNMRIPSTFFSDLNKVIKYNFGRNIKWFHEEKF
jgi:uracil-DNA glycosylase